MDNANDIAGKHDITADIVKKLKKTKRLQMRLSWRNSNKMVSLSGKQRAARSVTVMCYGYYPNGFRFDSHLADFVSLFFFTFFQA